MTQPPPQGDIEWIKETLFRVSQHLESFEEDVMAAIDDLKKQNTQIKTQMVTLAEEIQQQIQQLADALGNQAEVEAVAADMQGTSQKLQQFITSLQADDPTAPPAPTNP